MIGRPFQSYMLKSLLFVSVITSYICGCLVQCCARILMPKAMLSFRRVIFQPVEKLTQQINLTERQITILKVKVEVMRMLTFDNDESGYLQWVNDNPSGFVINTPKRPGDFPDMLHRANCKSISTDQRTNYTTTAFKKICSIDRQELAEWGARHSGDFHHCKICSP